MYPNRRRILPIFTVNYLKKFMTNFQLNLVKKNYLILPQNYGNFTSLEFYGIFASLVFISDQHQHQHQRPPKSPCTEFHPNLFIFIISVQHIEFFSLDS